MMTPATQRRNLVANIERFGLDLDPDEVMALPAPERQQAFSEALDRSIRDATPLPDGGPVRNFLGRPEGLGVRPDPLDPNQQRRAAVNRLPEPISREEAISARERRQRGKRREGQTRSSEQAEADRQSRVEAARTRIRDRIAKKIARRNGREEPSESDRREAEIRMPVQYPPRESSVPPQTPASETARLAIGNRSTPPAIPGRSQPSGGVPRPPLFDSPILSANRPPLMAQPPNQQETPSQEGPFGSVPGVRSQNPAQIRQFALDTPL